MKKICYHHNDADGRMAAAIVKSCHPDCKFVEVKYGDDWNTEDVINAMVFVVDFSFPYMEDLDKACELLCWIDHHETAMKDNPDFWLSDNIDGLREIGKCGALLAWEWFCPHKYAPKSVLLVNDYDIWAHKMGEETHWLAEADCNWTVDQFLGLLNEDPHIDDVLMNGSQLYEAKKIRCQKAIERGSKMNLVFENTIYDCFTVNCYPTDSSLIGSMILDLGYKIAIPYFIDKEIISYGLRSRGDLDVGAIAKEFGGGGHKNASGFRRKFDGPKFA